MLHSAKRLIIKTGSSLVTDAHGAARTAWLASMATDIAKLRASGKQIIIVTSGAVALGRGALKLSAKVLTLEEKQAAAACGQQRLMAAWAEAFAPHGITVGQILLTADDSSERRRYLNARNTLDTLLSLNAIPIINENDTVATAELRIGDNDRLSARVAQMAGADCLVLLSDVDGLYEADPRKHPGAAFIPEIRGGVTPAIEAMAGGTDGVGTGGMVTKLAAAKIALAAGCHMVIARGDTPHPLAALQAGGRATWFVAAQSPLSARKTWIAGSLHPMGSFTVDAGAATALRGEKSLLPAGITAISGTFERGDAVLILDAQGVIIGKGLTAYGSADAARIMGRNSKDIEHILGFRGRAAVVHRDDLVME